ncbi:hypothetical protein [Pseudonocardia sp. WMMC193]|uniref:hypothetical protein n=1 Tax=Pseudonocardia sp. WMMC193 TaxID=2911965 RepID=UPI001F2C9468|nr:hypothetical protein [Pseudonocardia sp. WMMC193]MCF7547355.1 hypothetical protein [Pseudonocardia sp. WMMC193]
MPDPDFGSADYELRWPRELFARELAALRRTRPSGQQVAAEDERIVFLLDEAFLGQTPSDDYRQATKTRRAFGDPWGTDPDPFGVQELDAEGYRDALLERLPQLREHHEPRPYWPDRQRARRAQDAPGDETSVRRRFARLIEELREGGLFGRELPPDCVDADPVDEADVLEARLGMPGLWPLQPENWDADTFYGLIEVFHDLAVRPRERWFHSYNGCGWHYSVFNTDTGRALYRWQINRLLERAGLPLRLAESGEDIGRLVHVTDPGRAELLDRALTRERIDDDTGVTARVRHAISLFRRRDTTEHDKRSAVIALAGILEERRDLIRAELGRKDEGALFALANEFAIRHQRRGQQGDYDPAFLDWIFWWYLGTVELTEAILTRQRRAEGERTA